LSRRKIDPGEKLNREKKSSTELRNCCASSVALTILIIRNTFFVTDLFLAVFYDLLFMDYHKELFAAPYSKGRVITMIVAFSPKGVVTACFPASGRP
jgi:hypothetical protein